MPGLLARSVARAWRCLESRSLLRTPGRIASAVGVCTRSSEFAGVHDEVFIADRPTLKPAFEDLAHAGGIACLRGERGTGGVRGHRFERHGPPRMIARRGLRKPDVTGVAGELSTLERTNDCITITDLAASRVHEVGASLHLRNQRVVE